MKKLIILSLLLLQSVSFSSQSFTWANSYGVTSANEVAGFDVDNEGNIFSVGVFGAEQSLPFHGDSYILKVSDDGAISWQKQLLGNTFFGDLVAVGNKVCIVGQAIGPVVFEGIPIFTGDQGYMFLLLLDSNGDIEWSQQYSDRHGQFANLESDDQTIALQARGQANSGNHIMHFDIAGNILEQRAFLDISILDLAYYNGKTYLNCQGGFNEFLIDGVSIASPVIESSTFILGLDENLTAEWAHVSSTINNHDGRVEANLNGIFSYQSTIDEEFTFSKEIWKLDFEGNLIASITPPVFSSALALYPDLAVSDCHVALFTENDFNFDSHEIILLDSDLEVVDEKFIDGGSNLYSGQIASYNNQFYFAHVHTATLNFNDEFILPHAGDGLSYPYIGKLSVEGECEEEFPECAISVVIPVLVECVDDEFFVNFFVVGSSSTDSINVEIDNEFFGTYADNSSGILIGPFNGDGASSYDVVFIDTQLEDCSFSISIDALDCSPNVIQENQISLNIYPNPADNGFFIEGFSDEAVIEIMDLSGRIIAMNFINHESQYIDLNSFDSGIYFVRFRDQSGSILSSMKIIKK